MEESDLPFSSLDDEALSQPESGEEVEAGAYSRRHSITRHTLGERNGRTSSKVAGSPERFSNVKYRTLPVKKTGN